jgi:uncharacterized membrane protein (DUF106 family)
MADYLGVPAGVMIKQVARKSEADAAGLRAFDVVLKVGTEPISTVADWDRAIRSNEGKAVAITIVRDRKQQTVTLQVDSKRKGEVEYPGLLPDGPEPLLAELDGFLVPELAAEIAESSEALREQVAALTATMSMAPLNQAQVDQLREQAQQLHDRMNAESFGVDPNQMEELRRQIEQFRQSFKPEDFKIEPKQLDELKQRMQQFQQEFKAEQFGIDPKQMEELRRQMEEFRKTFETAPQQLDRQGIQRQPKLSSGPDQQV